MRRPVIPDRKAKAGDRQKGSTIEDADRFDSVITCLLTSYDSSDIDTRVRLEPSPENGLNKVSYVMTDKIVTVDRNPLGYKVGVVDDTAMANIGRQLIRVPDLP